MRGMQPRVSAAVLQQLQVALRGRLAGADEALWRCHISGRPDLLAAVRHDLHAQASVSAYE